MRFQMNQFSVLRTSLQLYFR